MPLAGMRQITIPSGQRTLVYRRRFSSIPLVVLVAAIAIIVAAAGR